MSAIVAAEQIAEGARQKATATAEKIVAPALVAAPAVLAAPAIGYGAGYDAGYLGYEGYGGYGLGLGKLKIGKY